ncbi:concanavalin A-like lectin/glucanase [Lophium mytilinum]|uniref:Concanavalin A-like lectin/glucanase n=1 Tax=Lophium mytilinum TaxID=390894 RepID=A0A6A6R3D3_9PEZI|nr:concanavalin A-like lectin/glucanase [Lophium mytilinum]
MAWPETLLWQMGAVFLAPYPAGVNAQSLFNHGDFIKREVKETVLLCGHYIQCMESGAVGWAVCDSRSPHVFYFLQKVGNNGTTFEATWKWETDPSNVHSYPRVKFNTPLLPVQLSNLSSLLVETHWSMSPATSLNLGNDLNGLSKINMIANVAIDMFADADPKKAQSETEAAFEIMLWLGSFGNPQPLGFRDGSGLFNQTLGNLQFKLFTGHNPARGHDVFSWMAPSNVTDFNEDISPLIQAL